MKRLQAGDAQALDPLYRRYRGVVNAIIHRQSRDGSIDAEDVCHEVFLTLRQLAPRYRAGTTLKGWLCGIAIRKARRVNETRWLRTGLLARFFWSEPVSERSENLSDIERVLSQLPEPMREVVVLTQLEQLSAEDVAEALNINVKTVWTRLHRARERIRDLVEAPAR